MLFNEEEMLELCKEMGIEVVEGRGYSMVNGVEIDPNDIDTLFDFPVYDLSDMDTADTRLSYKWSAPTPNNYSIIQIGDIPSPLTTVGKINNEFEASKVDCQYECLNIQKNIYSELNTSNSELCAA